MFKTLKDFEFNNKKVLVRCDFNVPLEKNKVSDDFRIEKTLPTINYLIEKGAKLILISHHKNNISLKPIADYLRNILRKNVKFIADCQGKRTENEVKKMKSGEIVLLENLRFYPEEEKNDESFGKGLAKLADIYISEAFSVAHRPHASIVSAPKFLPKGIGFQFEEEFEVLSKLLTVPLRPQVIIIGGAKISSKVKIIENFLRKADHLLLGGKIANAILAVKGIVIGGVELQEEIVSKIKNLNLTSTKIHLPIDVIASPDQSGEVYIRQTGPGGVRGDEGIFDIGPETIETFSRIIKEAATIVWAGPLGLWEKEKFGKGTREIAEIIAKNTSAFSVAGGGDTISAIKKFNLLDKFSFVSTGGGAMLSFLAEEKLPGIEALKV